MPTRSGAAGRALGDLAREQLGHGGLLHEGLAGHLEARRVVRERAHGLDLGGRLRDLVLHALEVGDARAELLALEGVGDREVHGALRDAEHLRRDADAALVQRLDRDLVAHADLADDALGRHAHALERQGAARARADSELVLGRPVRGRAYAQPGQGAGVAVQNHEVFFEGQLERGASLERAGDALRCGLAGDGGQRRVRVEPRHCMARLAGLQHTLLVRIQRVSGRQRG